MANWQDNFRGYATETAFAVSVSRAQVSLMAALEAEQWQGWSNAGGAGNLYTTFQALKRRGLAEYNDAKRDDGDWKGWRYRLTPAGQMVLDLAKMAGVQSALAYAPVANAA
jgi:hypothetical protein